MSRCDFHGHGSLPPRGCIDARTLLPNVCQVTVSVNAADTTKATGKFLGSTRRGGCAGKLSTSDRGTMPGTLGSKSLLPTQLPFLLSIPMLCYRMRRYRVRPGGNHEVSERVFKFGRRVTSSLAIGIRTECLIRTLKCSICISLRVYKNAFPTIVRQFLGRSSQPSLSIYRVALQLLKCRHLRGSHDLLNVSILIFARILCLSLKHLLLEHSDCALFCRIGPISITFYQVVHFEDFLFSCRYFRRFPHSNSRQDILRHH